MQAYVSDRVIVIDIEWYHLCIFVVQNDFACLMGISGIYLSSQHYDCMIYMISFLISK